MNDLTIKMYGTLKAVLIREEGQDLVEYAWLLHSSHSVQLLAWVS
jgi:hypothetical protein